MSSRLRAAMRMAASFLACVTVMVMASELADDLEHDKEHFTGPSWAKALAWLVLTLLAAQEIEKVRRRFEEVIG